MFSEHGFTKHALTLCFTAFSGRKTAHTFPENALDHIRRTGGQGVAIPMGGILFYVQHMLGIGHLRRTALIAEAVSDLGAPTVMVSGGVPVPDFMPKGVELVQLPPLKAGSGGFRDLCTGDGQSAGEAYKHARLDALIGHIHAYKPRIVVVESFPFGRWPLAYELLPMLEAIKSLEPRPVVVASIRDILQISQRPDRAARIRELLGQYYQAVLVHGDPKLVELSETFPDFDAIRKLVHYTGLVTPPLERLTSGAKRKSEVLVSIGGGAVGERLLWTALEARSSTCFDGNPWRFITGPNISERDFNMFQKAVPDNVKVDRFRKDFRSLLAEARLSISMAGYNTTAEILRAGTPAVLIAYTGGGGETEQSMRAGRLAERGLAAALSDQDLSPENLCTAIGEAAKGPQPMSHEIDLEGASKSAELLLHWMKLGAICAPKP